MGTVLTEPTRAAADTVYASTDRGVIELMGDHTPALPDETGAPRWLTAAQMRSWLRLQAVVELLPGVLDAQLQRDSGLAHYEYLVLAVLSEAPDRSLRMSALAHQTNATLPRLSHVVRRLEDRGLVRRATDTCDRRATIASLTEAGWVAVVAAAPGHARTVLEHVYDQLDDDEVAVFESIMDRIVRTIDPADRLGVLRDDHPAIHQDAEPAGDQARDQAQAAVPR
jgi:DNA-binding MarR family transcriptional regulator